MGREAQGVLLAAKLPDLGDERLGVEVQGGLEPLARLADVVLGLEPVEQVPRRLGLRSGDLGQSLNRLAARLDGLVARPGDRVRFHERGEVAEGLVFSVLGRSPREPPADRRVEDREEPGVLSRKEIRRVVREILARRQAEIGRPGDVLVGDPRLRELAPVGASPQLPPESALVLPLPQGFLKWLEMSMNARVGLPEDVLRTIAGAGPGPGMIPARLDRDHPEAGPFRRPPSEYPGPAG